jgi:hypothetical protein
MATTTDISTVARHLFETQGPQATAEAAQKAADFYAGRGIENTRSTTLYSS